MNTNGISRDWRENHHTITYKSVLRDPRGAYCRENLGQTLLRVYPCTRTTSGRTGQLRSISLISKWCTVGADLALKSRIFSFCDSLSRGIKIPKHFPEKSLRRNLKLSLVSWFLKVCSSKTHWQKSKKLITGPHCRKFQGCLTLSKFEHLLFGVLVASAPQLGMTLHQVKIRALKKTRALPPANGLQWNQIFRRQQCPPVVMSSCILKFRFLKKVFLVWYWVREIQCKASSNYRNL
mgnify:CR=1 FL=1